MTPSPFCWTLDSATGVQYPVQCRGIGNVTDLVFKET